jgi:hypothetical protein
LEILNTKRQREDASNDSVVDDFKKAKLNDNDPNEDPEDLPKIFKAPSKSSSEGNGNPEKDSDSEGERLPNKADDYDPQDDPVNLIDEDLRRISDVRDNREVNQEALNTLINSYPELLEDGDTEEQFLEKVKTHLEEDRVVEEQKARSAEVDQK